MRRQLQPAALAVVFALSLVAGAAAQPIAIVGGKVYPVSGPPIENATVLVNDDVSVENSTHTTGRRGVAGTVIVEKIVGAGAERGMTLFECKALGDRVNESTASMGSCTLVADYVVDNTLRRY